MLHIGSTLNYNIIKSFQSRDWFSSYISDFSSIKICSKIRIFLKSARTCMSCTLPITKRNPLNADNYVVSFCSWQTGLLLYVKESINYHQRWSNLGGVTHCVNNSTESTFPQSFRVCTGITPSLLQVSGYE